MTHDKFEGGWLNSSKYIGSWENNLRLFEMKNVQKEELKESEFSLNENLEKIFE